MLRNWISEKLIENAYIYLDLRTQNDQIFFTIENNYDSNGTSSKPGIGLDNLKQRLIHLYPNRHELKIEKTENSYKAQLNLLIT